MDYLLCIIKSFKRRFSHLRLVARDLLYIHSYENQFLTNEFLSCVSILKINSLISNSKFFVEKNVTQNNFFLKNFSKKKTSKKTIFKKKTKTKNKISTIRQFLNSEYFFH